MYDSLTVGGSVSLADIASRKGHPAQAPGSGPVSLPYRAQCGGQRTRSSRRTSLLVGHAAAGDELSCIAWNASVHAGRSAVM